MSKRIFAIVVLVMMIFAIGCNQQSADDNNSETNNGVTDNSGTDNSGTDNSGNVENGRGVEEKNDQDEFFYRGVVTETDNKRYIVMEIIDSNVAFGIYHALVSDQTAFVNSDGSAISRDQIKVGDTIEVIFSGQVMLSMPPQIAAQKIILK